MTLYIARATEDEAAVVHRIMQAAYAEFRGVLEPASGAHQETVEDVRRGIGEGGALLAWEDGVAVGSARYTLYPDHFYVGRVSVLPEQRGKGIATAMLREMERIAHEQGSTQIRLSVRMALPRNLDLYTRLGYQIDAQYAHERGDGTQMVAKLSKVLT